MTTEPKPYAGTIRDDNAPHQIRIIYHQHLTRLAVSCTCLATGHSGNHGPSYTPIRAGITTTDQAWIEWHAYHDRQQQNAPPHSPTHTKGGRNTGGV